MRGVKPELVHRDVARVAGQMSVAIVRGLVNRAAVEFWIATLRNASRDLENYLTETKNTS